MTSVWKKSRSAACDIDVLLLDFGGVLAEEGFREGLKAIGHLSGTDPDAMVRKGFDLIHATGYVVGRAEESAFWDAMRERGGAHGSNETLRNEILTRFVIRPWMLAVVDRLREAGLCLGILSDQTQWLDELNERHNFFRHFHHVFNSFHTGLSKRDPAAFDDAVQGLVTAPGRVLFVDDHTGNVERAEDRGLRTILYTDRENFLRLMIEHCPFLSHVMPP